jgi:hypothetical protein
MPGGRGQTRALTLYAHTGQLGAAMRPAKTRLTRPRIRPLKNQLKKQLRKESRNAWRGFIEEITTGTRRQHNAGLWRLLRWARKKAGKPHDLSQLPPLRGDNHSPYTEDNKEKARTLAEKFFPHQ